MSKSIVKGIGIGCLSCIGIAKMISQVLVLVLLRGQPKYWYWYMGRCQVPREGRERSVSSDPWERRYGVSGVNVWSITRHSLD